MTTKDKNDENELLIFIKSNISQKNRFINIIYKSL